jgi:hypothetical protein
MTIFVKPTAAEVALANGSPSSFSSNTGGSTAMGGVTGHDVLVRVVNPSNSALILITRYAANNTTTGAFSNVVVGTATLAPLNTEYFALSKNEWLGANGAANAAPVAVVGV